MLVVCTNHLATGFSVRMNRRQRTFFALIVLATASVVAVPALAFERTMTCVEDDSDSPIACREGETPIPIWWSPRCVPYLIQQDGTGDMADFDRVIEEIIASADTWNAVDCAAFEMGFEGLTDGRNIGVVINDEGVAVADANRIVFVDQGWRRAPLIQALTTVSYRASTGEIVDADMEINTENFDFGIVGQDEGTGITDLRNTVTHEFGHFLGLDHTAAETMVGGTSEQLIDTTMYAQAGIDEIKKQDLHPDDIAGICDAYPLPEDGESCGCEYDADGLLVGEVGECAPADPSGADVGNAGSGGGGGGGCSAANTSPSLPWGLLLLGGFLYNRRRCTPRRK